MSPKKHEILVSWYLRLNGYFTVNNFIVHAGDDPARISNDHVAPHTEVDTLAIRMPYSAEVAGSLCIANHDPLVGNQNSRRDFVIAESKSGKSNRPNRVWHKAIIGPIEYIIRFSGLFEDEKLLTEAAKALASNYHYENNNVRIRYIIFAEKKNDHYAKRGVSYITYCQIIKFLVEVRGKSWLTEKIGVASIHQQWDDFIKEIFCVANNRQLDDDEKIQTIARMLNS